MAGDYAQTAQQVPNSRTVVAVGWYDVPIYPRGGSGGGVLVCTHFCLLVLFVVCTDYLTSRLQREKTSEVFEELPFHYLEIASLLLKK